MVGEDPADPDDLEWHVNQTHKVTKHQRGGQEGQSKQRDLSKSLKGKHVKQEFPEEKKINRELVSR